MPPRNGPAHEPAFAELTTRAQVARLRRVGLRALEAYRWPRARMRLAAHGFNCTFRVDTPAARYALRLHMNSQRTHANIRAELAWLAALARETELTLPVPVPLPDGRAFQQVDAPEVGRPVPAAVFSWLPGRDLARRDDPRATRALGRATAELHRHASGWQLPRDAAAPIADDVFMHQPPALLTATHPALPDTRQQLFVSVCERAHAVLQALYAAGRPHLLHFDLHPWNVKWLRGRLAIFDFDDCAIGCPVQDLSTTIYYLRARPNGVALEQAYLEGYTDARPLPIPLRPDLETLLMARVLLLANDLMSIETAEERAYLPTYLARAELMARQFLDTGQFVSIA